VTRAHSQDGEPFASNRRAPFRGSYPASAAPRFNAGLPSPVGGTVTDASGILSVPNLGGTDTQTMLGEALRLDHLVNIDGEIDPAPISGDWYFVDGV
jgi:hypothetical protein